MEWNPSYTTQWNHISHHFIPLLYPKYLFLLYLDSNDSLNSPERILQNKNSPKRILSKSINNPHFTAMQSYHHFTYRKILINFLSKLKLRSFHVPTTMSLCPIDVVSLDNVQLQEFKWLTNKHDATLFNCLAINLILI